MNKNLLVFVVEDNKLYHKLVVDFLRKQGLKRVKSFYNAEDCLAAVNKGERPDIVIEDYHLNDTTGIAVLQEVKKISERTEFIFLTSHEDMEVAVNSIKYGAFDYIIKDNDIALKKVYNKIGKISKIIELEKRNRFVQNAMAVSLAILVAIVVLVALREIFNVF
ncbi:response regulator [Draconibacterium sediminis]|uniref:response regulator n=1 Tax=Draconibacterium sediminis TaxID=1544798 RepID=UPI0026EAE199|nr:response regulator [Draconibacterium sediminis]